MRTRYQTGGLAAMEDDEDADASVYDPDADELDEPGGAVTASGGLAALDLPGAAEAFRLMQQSSADARKALQDARSAIMARQYGRADALLAASAALGAPTRTGSTAESFGAMAGALRGPLAARREFETQKEKDLLGVNTQLAGLDEREAQARLALAQLQARLQAQAQNAPLEKVIVPGKDHPEFMTRIQARGRPAWTAPAASTNIQLSTGKKFLDTLAENTGKLYTEQFEAALKAPQEMERVNRIKKLLDSPAYTGLGANWKLAFDKGLAAAGLDFGGDKIANTEQLAAELAAGTLALIKPSGLGGGTGFSNADRDFIERVAGGKYTLDLNTLKRLATLHERAQKNVVGKWNETYKRLNAVPENVASLRQMGLIPISFDEQAADESEEDAPDTTESAAPTAPGAPAIPSPDEAAATEPGTVSFYSLKKRKP